MSTVYASLPFYDSLVKQDKNRTGAIIPFHCPRHQLPPFLINAEGDTIGTVDEILLVDCDGAETDITSYFETLPEVITVGSDTYIEYEGDTLNTILPTGSYYVQLTGGTSIFYSDWIRISNIYKNLIKTLQNGGTGYDTFTSSRVTTLSAISDGTGDSFAGSIDKFSVSKGEVITVIFNETLNSGVAPQVRIRNATGAGISGTTISNIALSVSGLNAIELTITQATTTAAFGINNDNGDASNFSTSEIWVMRQYSPQFVKLAFSNINDIGNILYSTGYSQEVWIQSRLNNPSHEITEIGDEKDGIFIAEKIVTSFIYKLIGYISRGLYNCLIRMPQSDSIVITDEVGNTYTPDVGNVVIEPIDWVYYETGKITILFNDGSNSAFKWTSNLDNLI